MMDLERDNPVTHRRWLLARLLAALIACLALALPASAQCSTSFLQGFRSPGVTMTVASTNSFLGGGLVNVLLPFDPDDAGPLPEHLLAAGRFGNMEGTPALHLAIFDGSAWTNPMPLPARLTPATIEAVAFYRDQWYIAGNLTNTDGFIDLYRWAGTQWEALGANISGGLVKVLAVFDGQLFIAGSFTSVQGQSGTRGIARLMPDGALQAVAAGLDGDTARIETMQAFASDLYIGGSFTSVSGIASVGIARWTQGAAPAWQATPGLASSADINIRSFAVLQGEFYAGGVLRDATNALVGLAKLDTSGPTGPMWQALSNMQGLTNVKIRSLASLSLPAGSVLVALTSEPFSGLTGNQQALAFDGTTWTSILDAPPAPALALGVQVSAGSWTCAAAYGGKLVMGTPALTSANAACATALVTWDGERFGTFANGLDGTVADFAVFEGDIVLAGAFRFAGGQRVNGIARFDGTRFAPLGAGVLSSSGSTAQLAFDVHVFNNQLYVSGQLGASTPSGTLGAVARWDGATWVRTVSSGNTNPPAQVLQLATHNSQLFLASNATGTGIQRFVTDRWLAVNATSGSHIDIESWEGSLRAAGNVDGIRTWDGTTNWTQIASTAGMSGVIDMLPRTSDLLVFADARFPVGGAERSSVVRVSNNATNTVTPIGSLAVTNIGSLSGQLAEFQGDIWAAKQLALTGGSTPNSRVARWNNIAWQAIAGDVGSFAPGVNDASLIRASSVFVQDVVDGPDIVWIGGSFGLVGPIVNGLPTQASPFIARYVASSQPAFVQQPASAEWCASTQASLSVMTDYTQDVSHRWRRNGVLLVDGTLAGVGVVSGATTSTLMVTGVLATAGGNFDCIATTSCGTTVSSSAVVNVVPVPTILQQPSNARFCVGASVTLSVAASANATGYTWRRGEVDLLDGEQASGSMIAGVLTNQLVISNVQLDDSDSYRCVVNGLCGSVTSSTSVVSYSNNCCDDIDFNGDDLFPADEDVVEFLNVFAGGTCSEGNTCNDIDFNNDSLFPDDADVLAFLRVFAGGTCAAP